MPESDDETRAARTSPHCFIRPGTRKSSSGGRDLTREGRPRRGGLPGPRGPAAVSWRQPRPLLVVQLSSESPARRVPARPRERQPAVLADRAVGRLAAAPDGHVLDRRCRFEWKRWARETAPRRPEGKRSPLAVGRDPDVRIANIPGSMLAEGGVIERDFHNVTRRSPTPPRRSSPARLYEGRPLVKPYVSLLTPRVPNCRVSAAVSSA